MPVLTGVITDFTDKVVTIKLPEGPIKVEISSISVEGKIREGANVSVITRDDGAVRQLTVQK